MSELHWAVFALRDIRDSLDCERYDVAAHHIDDAIAALLARDEQSNDEEESTSTRQADRGKIDVTWMLGHASGMRRLPPCPDPANS